MPAPRFGETDEEVQNEAQKSILRVFHALILSDFFGASALTTGAKNEGFRLLLQKGLNAMLERESSEQLGAKRYERTDERTV